MSVFKIKKNVSAKPGDPNYDLFELACKVSAKRMFPNFGNVSASYNIPTWEGASMDSPDDEYATMGCVEGGETIRYMIDNVEYIEPFRVAYDRVTQILTEQTYSKNTDYVDTSKTDIKIWDSSSNDFVQVKKFIRNRSVNNWNVIKFNKGYSLTATSDHPLPVIGKGRTFVKDLKVGDKIPLSDSMSEFVQVLEITAGCPDDKDSRYSYDVETVTDRFDVSGLQSHNCRTRVFTNIRNNGINGSVGRGNLSFTSINLPRLAILAGRGNIDKFFRLLDNMMDLVHRQLQERFEIQCMRHPRNYPFLMGQGLWRGSENLGPDDDIRDALKNGTQGVGFIGLAECLVALTGKHHGESEDSQKLGLRIVGHMRELTDRWSIEEGMNYSVLGTPAEGLSGRFIKIDQKRFGKIPGVTDREYYTNSSHVPVYYPISAFKKIDIEAPYHKLENGGHICYIEMDGDPAKNIKAFKKIVQYAYDHDIGYFAINHAIDRDPVCGYTGIINDVCPRCGRREGEAMTMENWIKIHNKFYSANTCSCGYCGDTNEEADRMRMANFTDQVK